MAAETKTIRGKHQFFFTTAANHPGGAGYWEVRANNEEDARLKMHFYFGSAWAFCYQTLDAVHWMDRENKHGIIL